MGAEWQESLNLACRCRPFATLLTLLKGADCVVTALLDAPADGHLTADEVAAVDALSASGLVAPLRFVRAV